VLILTSGTQPALVRSSDNLSKVSIRDAASASTLDLLDAKVVLIEEGAIDSLTAVLSGKTEVTSA